MSLRRDDDVLLMLSRYEDLCNGRDRLPSVAQFCLTVLEDLAGNRENATKKFRIERKVLDQVGELADKKWTAMARKYKGIDEELTPGETRFLENVVKVFIRRVAPEKITTKDFSEVWLGPNKDAPKWNTSLFPDGAGNRRLAGGITPPRV